MNGYIGEFTNRGEIMTVNIKTELAEAIDRTGWQKNILAQAMHTTKSNVSNWLSADRDIPNVTLFELTKVLQDYKFNCKVAEYITGIHILADDGDFEATPQAQYFRAKKEESERKALDDDITILLGKRPSERTQADVDEIKRYLKEFDEESETEEAFKLAIMDNWGLTPERSR